MKLLVTGAAGAVGSFLARYLADRGYELVLLDREESVQRLGRSLQAAAYLGSVEDRALVERALAGADALVHCAWSFSDDPLTTFTSDVVGYLSCLEAGVRHQLPRVLFLSSAVVYGRPRSLPVTEEHPCLVEQSRNPLYAAAKLAAEHLGYVYFQRYGMGVTNLRFWWAYGEEIGGRNLREMVKKALAGETLQVPAGAGGSFLHLSDLAAFVERWLACSTPAHGQTLNLGTAYLTWEQVAGLIVDLTGSPGGYRAVDPGNWRGGSFLLGTWNLSWTKARDLLGFVPGLSPAEALAELRAALVLLVDKLRPPAPPQRTAPD